MALPTTERRVWHCGERAHCEAAIGNGMTCAVSPTSAASCATWNLEHNTAITPAAHGHRAQGRALRAPSPSTLCTTVKGKRVRTTFASLRCRWGARCQASVPPPHTTCRLSI